MNRIQKLELEILKQVVAVLDANKMKYYLWGGTLLGAVRHKGFIPWDDDIDIVMPRKDYDEFVDSRNILLPEHLHLKHMSVEPNDSKNIYLYTSVYDDRYEIKCDFDEYSYDHEYLRIDVFPIDHVPNSCFARFMQNINVLYRKGLFRCSKINLLHRDRVKSKWKRLIYEISSLLHTERFLNTKHLAKQYDDVVKRFKNCNTKNVFIYLGVYREKSFFLNKDFGQGRLASFEDTDFRIPNNYDKILTKLYGEYMIPPPQSDRFETHSIRLI